MFSFPHDAILLLSIGENFKHRMLKSDVYFATISGFCPYYPILVMSHTMTSSLLCESLPTDARYLPSWEKARHLRDVTGIVIMDTHLPLSYSQMRIIEFLPS